MPAKPQKTYPDKEYASLSIPRQHYLELCRALDKVMHAFGVAESAHHAPSAEVFKRLPNLILWALRESKLWAKCEASYTPSLWLQEKEKRAESRATELEETFKKTANQVFGESK